MKKRDLKVPVPEKQQVDIVYVVDKDGNLMMPTTRKGRIRHLLKDGKARIFKRTPFTVQLLYDTPDKKQDLVLSVDPGRTNIGVSVLTKTGKVVYSANVTTRNKDIPKLMKERKAHRQASRRGERLRRKRRARANNTTTTFPSGRKLPGYKEGVMNLKDIINSEARFNNRKRPISWFTPTARQLLQTFQSITKHIQRFLPITDIAVELNKFAFMKMEDGSVFGVDFQNGKLKGYTDVREYVEVRQDHKCYLCGKEIEHVHHIVPRRENGSDNADNLVGLCKNCHDKVHQGKKKISLKGFHKKYAGTSVLNQSLPYFIQWLMGEFGELHVRTCLGWQTKENRESLNLDKDHYLDAISIASFCYGIQDITVLANSRKILQFRNHNRQRINNQRERTYKLDGNMIAKNRRPREEQPKGTLALSDWFSKVSEEQGRHKAMQLRSRLKVEKSVRRYNSLGRTLPGQIFLFKGNAYIMSGQISNGVYLRAVGCENFNFPAKDCTFLKSKRSLVYA